MMLLLLLLAAFAEWIATVFGDELRSENVGRDQKFVGPWLISQVQEAPGTVVWVLGWTFVVQSLFLVALWVYSGRPLWGRIGR